MNVAGLCKRETAFPKPQDSHPDRAPGKPPLAIVRGLTRQADSQDFL